MSTERIIRNRISLIPIIIYIFSIVLFTFSNIFVSKSFSTIINIGLIIFIQIFILLIFKFDFIFNITLFTSLSLIPSVLVYYSFTNKNLGDLTSGLLPIYMYEETFYVLLFMLVFSFSAYLFNVNFYERKKLVFHLPRLNNSAIVINNIIAIIFTFVSLPAIPRLSMHIKEYNFANALLPGGSWNQLAIVALLFNLPYLNKKRSVAFTYLFVVIWFILHGERADISGLILGLIIMAIFSNHISRLKKTIMIVGGLLLIILFISIKAHSSIYKSINSIFTFSTLSDTSYELNGAIGYVKNVGLTHGKILISTLESAVPLVHGTYNVGYFFRKYFLYPGGSSIIDEPLMDFGNIGIIIITLIYSSILKIIVKGHFKFYRYELLILICSIPRIAWYGVNYVFSSMLFFVPFIFILDYYLMSNNSDLT